MNAMIFAAGLGSRLRPLTNTKPKALIEIGGTPMLEIALRNLEKAGINKVVVNVHHYPEQIRHFLDDFHSPEMEILVSHEKDQLLDTGGGLLKARPLFDPNTPILLYNVDIVTTARLDHFMAFHQKESPLVSLMVKKRPTSRHLLFDDKMRLAGWQNTITEEKILVNPKATTQAFGFQGIHIINPEIFDLITEDGAFSIMKLYLRLAENHIIKGYDTEKDNWFDIGTPEKLAITEQYIKSHPGEFKNIL